MPLYPEAFHPAVKCLHGGCWWPQWWRSGLGGQCCRGRLLCCFLRVEQVSFSNWVIASWKWHVEAQICVKCKNSQPSGWAYFSNWTKALCHCQGSQGNTCLSSSSSSSSPTPGSNTLHLPRLKDCHSSLMAKKYKSSIVKNQSPICMKLYSRVVEGLSGGVRRTSCGCTVQVYFCW